MGSSPRWPRSFESSARREIAEQSAEREDAEERTRQVQPGFVHRHGEHRRHREPGDELEPGSLAQEG